MYTEAIIGVVGFIAAIAITLCILFDDRDNNNNNKKTLLMGFLRTGNRKASYNKAKKFNTEKSDRLVKLFAEVDNRMRKLDSILKEKLIEDNCKLLHTVIQSDEPYLNLIRIAEKIRVGNKIGNIDKDDMLLLIDVLLNDLLESLNEEENEESRTN